MSIPLYIVNAFTHSAFGGNPAAVCPLEQWLPDDVMQNMAAQHNLSETAFFVPAAHEDEADFHIRWFTPTHEVELCGHATLASCYIIFHELGFTASTVKLQSQVGQLQVTKEQNGNISMDFPKGNLEKIAVLGTFNALFGTKPEAAYACPALSGGSTDLVLTFENEAQVKDAQVHFKAIQTLSYRCFIITAPSEAADVDFVCRVFAPNVGIDEDPVTGSAFTLLAPLWAEKLGKTALAAKQLSHRGGDVWCAYDKNQPADSQDRVTVAGSAKLYAQGVCYL